MHRVIHKIELIVCIIDVTPEAELFQIDSCTTFRDQVEAFKNKAGQSVFSLLPNQPSSMNPRLSDLYSYVMSTNHWRCAGKYLNTYLNQKRL